jgi:hypothetical protein
MSWIYVPSSGRVWYLIHLAPSVDESLSRIHTSKRRNLIIHVFFSISRMTYVICVFVHSGESLTKTRPLMGPDESNIKLVLITGRKSMTCLCMRYVTHLACKRQPRDWWEWSVHKANVSDRIRCISFHSGVQHILCFSFALYTLCCQFLWIVFLWSSLRYCVKFIHVYLNTSVI